MKILFRISLAFLVCSFQLASGQSIKDYGSSGTDMDSLLQIRDSIPLVQVLLNDTIKDDRRLLKKSHFETSFNYQSNDVYLGRKDSSVLPYFIPEFSYYHKSGIFVSASLYY